MTKGLQSLNQSGQYVVQFCALLYVLTSSDKKGNRLHLGSSSFGISCRLSHILVVTLGATSLHPLSANLIIIIFFKWQLALNLSEVDNIRIMPFF